MAAVNIGETMNLTRRRVLHLAAGAPALPFVSSLARAENYPMRPVRIIVGFPPGGPTDTAARPMAQWLSERLGQQFVVENRPGAGSNIGTEAVVRAAPDGYTLLLAYSSNAINATLYDKLNFNFIRDIAPVASISRETTVMVVNPSVPAKTVSEFITYAKANSGKINFASGGSGTPPHVVGELFKMMVGVNLIHVPYRGGAPAVTDLLGGQVQVMFASPSISIQNVKAGKLRALAVTTATLGGASGRAPRRRVPIGLRGDVVARHAQEHAGGNHRQTQQGNQCGSCRTQNTGTICRPAQCFQDRPATLASSSPMKQRSGPK